MLLQIDMHGMLRLVCARDCLKNPRFAGFGCNGGARRRTCYCVRKSTIGPPASYSTEMAGHNWRVLGNHVDLICGCEILAAAKSQNAQLAWSQSLRWLHQLHFRAGHRERLRLCRARRCKPTAWSGTSDSQACEASQPAARPGC